MGKEFVGEYKPVRDKRTYQRGEAGGEKAAAFGIPDLKNKKARRVGGGPQRRLCRLYGL